MTNRARAAEETGERILRAAVERFASMTFDEVTLAEIADGAGVTVQTVIRRFGSKEDLFSLLADRERARIIGDRQPLESGGGSLEAAVRSLVGHYESDGRTVINFLNQENRFPMIAEVLADGRRIHEIWVQEHCAPVLSATAEHERKQVFEAAMAATDVYVWKVLRLDRGLSRSDVEETILTLLEGLTRGGQ